MLFTSLLIHLPVLLSKDFFAFSSLRTWQVLSFSNVCSKPCGLGIRKTMGTHDLFRFWRHIPKRSIHWPGVLQGTCIFLVKKLFRAYRNAWIMNLQISPIKLVYPKVYDVFYYMDPASWLRTWWLKFSYPNRFQGWFSPNKFCLNAVLEAIPWGHHDFKQI